LSLPALSVRRAALFAAVVGGLVHLGALWNGFAYDDLLVIAGDPGIHSLQGLWQRLGEPYWPGSFGSQVGAWRPVTTGLWALTWVASSGSTVALHLPAVLLHASVCALVVLLLSELMSTASALFGGLVFAVHPVHVEAIANIAGTAEPLAAMLALAAAVLLSPSNASLHHLLAESLSRMGRHQDAIESRVRALEGGLDGVSSVVPPRWRLRGRGRYSGCPRGSRLGQAHAQALPRARRGRAGTTRARLEP